MKKIIFAILALGFWCCNINAQSIDFSPGGRIKQANLQKTGNWQDVFTNFFQLAMKDISGEKRSFEFKSTVFALRSKVNPNLLVDSNYVKRAFDRNFQIGAALKLDSQYKFRAFSVGFTWAVVNKRDSTTLNFIGKREDVLFVNFAVGVTNALIAYKNQTGDSSKAYEEAESLVNKMLGNGKFDIDQLPNGFKELCKKEIQDDFNEVATARIEALKALKQKALLTISANANFAKGKGIFNGGEAELVYLKGVTSSGRPLELDLRANFTAMDTTLNNKRYRTTIGFTGGFNWGIVSRKDDTYSPIVEIKPHIEYQRITRGLYPGEKESLFTANATARVRIAKGLWIPFTLKYDLENNNFLGFLNVAFNWDYFK